jgi:hypothetical protein
MQPITLRLPSEVYEILRKRAFDNRTSMTALILEAIQLTITEDE